MSFSQEPQKQKGSSLGLFESSFHVLSFQRAGILNYVFGQKLRQPKAIVPEGTKTRWAVWKELMQTGISSF